MHEQTDTIACFIMNWYMYYHITGIFCDSKFLRFRPRKVSNHILLFQLLQLHQTTKKKKNKFYTLLQVLNPSFMLFTGLRWGQYRLEECNEGVSFPLHYQPPFDSSCCDCRVVNVFVKTLVKHAFVLCFVNILQIMMMKYLYFSVFACDNTMY